MKIIVGVPSLNEQDSIRSVVQAIDEGLSLYFSSSQSYIVNVDSGSTDQSVEIFLSTPTSCQKDTISAGGFVDRGKGRNIWELLCYSRHAGADVLALFDADVTTINPSWIKALITPVASDVSDFVAPYYARNRFEGSTTTHFALPLVYGCFGTFIRQPIGGEFAFGSKVISYLCQQEVIQSTMAYGIDIFMTMHAVGGGFRISEAYLGQKLHKPSFSKMRRMFPQVAQAGLACVAHYGSSAGVCGLGLEQASDLQLGVTTGGDFSHRSELLPLLENAFGLLEEKAEIYGSLFGTQLNVKMSLKDFLSPCPVEEWVDVLAVFAAHAGSKRTTDIEDGLGELLYPFFVRRATTFWLVAETLPIAEVEALIMSQAFKFRKTLLS